MRIILYLLSLTITELQRYQYIVIDSEYLKSLNALFLAIRHKQLLFFFPSDQELTHINAEGLIFQRKMSEMSEIPVS